MPEEEKEKKQNDEAPSKEKEMPGTTVSVFEKFILIIAGASFIIRQIGIVWKGQELIKLIDIALVIAILIGIDLLLKFINAELTKTRLQIIQYKHFDPELDYPLIESKMKRLHHRIQCVMHTCDPPYGPKSAEPYAVYVRFYEWLANSVQTQGWLMIAMPSRTIQKYQSGSWKLETIDRDWSGALKETKDRSLHYFLPSPAYVRPVIHTQPSIPKKEGEEEEESNE